MKNYPEKILFVIYCTWKFENNGSTLFFICISPKLQNYFSIFINFSLPIPPSKKFNAILITPDLIWYLD